MCVLFSCSFVSTSVRALTLATMLLLLLYAAIETKIETETDTATATETAQRTFCTLGSHKHLIMNGLTL